MLVFHALQVIHVLLSLGLLVATTRCGLTRLICLRTWPDALVSQLVFACADCMLIKFTCFQMKPFSMWLMLLICNGQILGQPRERECRKNVRKCPKNVRKISKNCPEGLKTTFSGNFCLFGRYYTNERQSRDSNHNSVITLARFRPSKRRNPPPRRLVPTWR